MSARTAPWLGRIGRLVVRELAASVAIALGAAITLFIAIDSVEAVNRALSRATVIDLLLLELCSIPGVLQQFGAFAAVLGGTAAVAALVRRGEGVAILAAGGSTAVILKPALLAGLALAAAESAMTEWIVPPARAELGAARRRLGLAGAGSEAASAGRSWFRGSDLVYRVDALEDTSGRTLAGVLILRIERGRLVERWDVERLRFAGGAWTGAGIVHRRFGEESLVTERIGEAPITLHEAPEDFVRSIGAPDRLSYAALVETTEARERLGQPAIAHRLELFRRRSRPVTLVFSLVLAAALGLRLGRRPPLATALAAAAPFGFLLWVFDEVGVALGSTGAMSPMAAAGVGPIAAITLAAVAWVICERRGLG